jgi:hypothetical protein
MRRLEPHVGELVAADLHKAAGRLHREATEEAKHWHAEKGQTLCEAEQANWAELQRTVGRSESGGG